VLLAKLTVFEDEHRRRVAAGAAYDAALKDVVAVQALPPATRHARGLYSVLVPDRPKFQEALKAAGVPTSIYYPMPLHLHAAFRPYCSGPGSLPVCERLAQHIVALPMHPYLTEADIARVVDAVRCAV